MKSEFLLPIELFTRVREDAEKQRYTILAALRRVRESFNQNKIYPFLSEVVELRRLLQSILDHLEDMRAKFPTRMSKVDLSRMEITHDVVFVDGSEVDRVTDLIRWTIPRLDDLIAEGAAIHEFVERETRVEVVGILPGYRESGYAFITDPDRDRLRLYRYDTSIFTSATERYRSLKTRFLEERPASELTETPANIKLQLIRRDPELPNPATFMVRSALGFPYRETFFPVARRLLMRAVAGQNG